MAEPTGRTEQLLTEVRAMPMFRQLVPMEAGTGWPIPVRHRPAWNGETVVYLRLPFYGFQRGAQAGATLYPPFATITLDWRTGRPVEYADLRYTRPWPIAATPEPVGRFPHDAVRGSIREYRAGRKRLLTLYDELMDSLVGGATFGSAEEFGSLLRRFVEPGLEPYYRALGPGFFGRFLDPAPARTAS